MPLSIKYPWASKEPVIAIYTFQLHDMYYP